MRVGIIGINFKSSELVLRELLAKACQICFGGESGEAERLNAVLLSTCNRTELYFSAEDLADAHSEILQLLRSKVETPFEHKLYSYFGEDCFFHLAEVASGLDSVIIAESEIQRQVKEAYEHACLYHDLPSCMHFMFQKSLKISKSIRTSFSFLTGANVSLEGIIHELGQNILKDLKSAEVLFIGNSEINRKILNYFKRKEVHQLTLCTRGRLSAQELAQEYALNLLEWSEMHTWQNFDVVICGTNQHDYLIYPEQLQAGCVPKNRIIFDLSMPRNADPRLTRHPQMAMLNIEELGRLIDKKQKRYFFEIAAASESVRESVKRQLEVFNRKSAYLFSGL